MRFKIQLVIEDGNSSEIIEEIIQLERDFSEGNLIGLSLLESKQMMKVLQNKIVLRQAKNYVELNRKCGNCSKNQPIKDYHSAISNNKCN